MDFLLEIGLEEVPARMLAGAEAELRERVAKVLERERLGGGEVRSYSTPRRLAVVVRGVRERQEDVAEEVMGPAVKIAYKEGQPGPAAVAFAKKAGVEVTALRVVETAKGEYVAATSVKAGRSAGDVLTEELPKEIAAIYWAKNMYWRAGKPERFVRPVKWLVALLGDAVVPVAFGGKTAGRVTYGHRVLHGAGAIEVTAEKYVEALRGAFVEPDVEVRRQGIRKALDRVCRGLGDGLRWREDHALVDKMTHLTEWPTVIAGGFEREYLELPDEVLVTVMRDHQNYFAVEQEGRLAAHFLAVLNTAVDAAGEAVIRHGNERVLRARFNDARFFWEFDRRMGTEERRAMLGNVTFQKDLGSYAEKTARVTVLTEVFAALARERGVAVDVDAAREAAARAKTDLTTELVKEFTELQGVIGGLYARAEGVPAAVCDAIYDQYLPESMEDAIPRTAEGQTLAIADKMDTVAGMFCLGMEPTGSKDPFALRRAANGIVRMLAEGVLPLGVSEVVRRGVAEIAASGKVRLDEAGFEQKVARLEVFFAERLEFYLREAKGQAYDVVKAVLAVGTDGVKDAVARAEAVTAVRGGEDFRAVSAAFKRMKNILAQAAEKGLKISNFSPLFATPVEANIWAAVSEAGAGFADDVRATRYVQALQKLSLLRPLIDQYFESVLVMDDDAEVRAHRLGTLHDLVQSFGRIAEFTEIVA